MTILLTRPRREANALAARLAPRPCLIAPVMEIVPLKTPLPKTRMQGLVFTSAAGVRSFAARSQDRRPKAYCVGPRTAEAARHAGFDAVAAGGTLRDLDDMLTRLGVDRSGLIHLGGRHRAGTLREVPHIAIYDQIALPRDDAACAAIAAGNISLAPLYSPRSAACLADWIGPDPVRLPHFLALSEAVAQALPWRRVRITTLAQPDGGLMEQKLRELYEA